MILISKNQERINFFGKSQLLISSGKWSYFLGKSFWKAPFCPEAPCGAFVMEKWRFLEILDMSRIKKYAFLEIWTFCQKWLPRPNHYAHETRSEILCRTPVSILLYLSPRPQNLRKTSYYSFLAWMLTLISNWRRRRRRRRRRRFPKNSGHLAEPCSNVPRDQISRSGNPSLRWHWNLDAFF